MKPILDELDTGIIQLLSRDGRMAYSEMAEKLDVTEKTIRSRYKNLIDNEIIKVTAVVNPISLGIKVVAIIHLKVAPLVMQEVISNLKEIKSIRFITMMSGDYQLLIQTFHYTYDALTEFLKELNLISGITEVNVSVQFEVYKNTFEYV